MDIWKYFRQSLEITSKMFYLDAPLAVLQKRDFFHKEIFLFTQNMY